MQWVNVIVRGFLIWIIPLAISFAFYSPQSELLTSYAWFKSVMVVVLTLTTLGVNLIRPIKRSSPLLIAVIYTAMSIVLDLLVLVPMTRMSLAIYVEQIALVYSIIFGITWGILRGRSMAERLDQSINALAKSAP
jgi:predicted neutral ceramidase superfamily lipid hydrolase